MYDSLDITFWAWLAGFLDGDGCFTVGVMKRTGKDGLTRFSVDPRICSSQKTSENKVLYFIKDKLSGGVYGINTRKSEWILGRLNNIHKICTVTICVRRNIGELTNEQPNQRYVHLRT